MSIATRSAGCELLRPIHSVLADHWNHAAFRFCAFALPEVLETLGFNEHTVLLAQLFAQRDMPTFYFG